MNNIFFEELGWAKVNSKVPPVYQIDAYEKVKVEGAKNIEKYIVRISVLDSSCRIYIYAGSKTGDGIEERIFYGTISNKEDLKEAQRLLNIK